MLIAKDSGPVFTAGETLGSKVILASSSKRVCEPILTTYAGGKGYKAVSCIK